LIQARLQMILKQPLWGLRHRLGPAGLGFMLLIALGLAACSQTTPTPTPTPTPEPTATPVPVAAMPPKVLLEDLSFPPPDQGQLESLSTLLSLVPGDYTSAVLVDINALEGSTLLRDAIDLEELGVPAIISTTGTGLLDRVGVASRASGREPITVLQGQIDIESLLQLAGGLGLSFGTPEAEDYRGHQVWNISVFGLTLAVGQADAKYVVFSSGSPAGGPTALELVKASLDSFDGLAPALSGNPATLKLLAELPSGFATTLLAGCAELANLGVMINLTGCVSAAVSAGFTQTEVVIYGLALFEEESLAAEAVQMAVEQIEAEATLAIGEVAIDQDQELVRVRVSVHPEQVAEALEGFLLPGR